MHVQRSASKRKKVSSSLIGEIPTSAIDSSEELDWGDTYCLVQGMAVTIFSQSADGRIAHGSHERQAEEELVGKRKKDGRALVCAAAGGRGRPASLGHVMLQLLTTSERSQPHHSASSRALGAARVCSALRQEVLLATHDGDISGLLQVPLAA